MHVIINEPAAVPHVAAADPEALIIYRVHFGPGRDEPSPWDWKGKRWTAQEWFDEWIKVLHPGIREDGGPYALTFKNEVWRPELAAFHNEFDVNLMRVCTRMGVRCTYGNYSVAVFQPYPSLWPGLRAVVDAAAGTGHILSANTYWFDEAPERFVYMAPIVQGKAASWCHGEVGWAAHDAKYQPGRELELAAQHDAAFAGRPGYVGGALWCLNASGGGWQHSHFISWDLIAKR